MNRDPRLPGAVLKMLAPWFECLNREERKWFIERLRDLKRKADFQFPNGKDDHGQKMPMKPVFEELDTRNIP